jgi:acetyl esterase/lipase
MLLDSADFVPPGVREQFSALILRSAIRLALKPAFSPRVSITSQRRWLRRLSQATCSAKSVEVQSGTVGKVKGVWQRPRHLGTITNSSATILYLHGGAYCVGSPWTHRALISYLAQSAGLPVFAADYRLSPEHPFPAAVEDAVSVYRSLVEMRPVVIAGDSAGAGLALACALALGQRQIKPPAALVLFSPWVDLTQSAIQAKALKGDVMLSTGWVDACARHYLAGQDASSPLVSPIYGDLRGLPPTLIQAGTEELLRDQAVRLHSALLEAGVTVRCEIVPGRWHVFQLHAGVLPSADAAIERAGNFITHTIAP